jgi:hypothetical protein
MFMNELSVQLRKASVTFCLEHSCWKLVALGSSDEFHMEDYYLLKGLYMKHQFSSPETIFWRKSVSFSGT